MKAYAQTIPTPDGMFTVIVDDTEKVLAAGWVATWKEIVDRIHVSIRPNEVFEALGHDALVHDDVTISELNNKLATANNLEMLKKTRSAVNAVNAYYAGDLEAPLKIAVCEVGTDLQKFGWKTLREIPPGETLNYTEFATRLGKPAAARVAASICAKNPVGLFTPCHRVLRGDGSLGGFAWGLNVKEQLLLREGSLEVKENTETTLF